MYFQSLVSSASLVSLKFVLQSPLCTVVYRTSRVGHVTNAGCSASREFRLHLVAASRPSSIDTAPQLSYLRAALISVARVIAADEQPPQTQDTRLDLAFMVADSKASM